jgi:hypothetical protein
MRRRLALALLLSAAAALLALPARGPVAAALTGRIVSPDGLPVPGARVRVQAADVGTTSDARGCFALRADPGRKVTAAADGFRIAGARVAGKDLTLRLDPLPAQDDPRYQWVDPSPDSARPHNCGNCHAEIYREWSASGHARSVSGSHFQDIYAGTDRDGTPGVGWGLLRQRPEGVGVCTACHAPAAADDDPRYYDLTRLGGVARRGVHCDYCHKVAGAGEGTVGLTHGRFALRVLRPSGDGQLFFGPLDDVDRGEDVYSPLYHESRYCAGCHEGVVFGVHAYSTYSEWLQSPARREGRQCQDCHMTPTGRMTNFAPGRGGLERDPRTLSSHRLFSPDQPAMLRRCIRVRTTTTRTPDGTRIRLEVSADGAGHRVPTGLPDRHLLLVADGEDASGRAVRMARGPTLPDAAGPGLAGRPGRLYAKLLHDFDGRSPAPFWAADPAALDNRLKPGTPDAVEMNFPPGLARLRVRVLYRRFWAEVARTKGWSDRDVVVLDETFEAR